MRGKSFKRVVFFLVCMFITVAWSQRGHAQERTDNTPSVNPLVRLLQVKGILTEEEAARINQATSPADANQQLAKLLLIKGVITQADYDQTVGAPRIMEASSTVASSGSVVATVYRVTVNKDSNLP